MSEYTTGWNTNILHRIAGAASHPIRYSVRATDKGCVKPCGIWRVASFQVSSSQKNALAPQPAACYCAAAWLGSVVARWLADARSRTHSMLGTRRRLRLGRGLPCVHRLPSQRTVRFVVERHGDAGSTAGDQQLRHADTVLRSQSANARRARTAPCHCATSDHAAAARSPRDWRATGTHNRSDVA
jgi:hypothetical protein